MCTNSPVRCTRASCPFNVRKRTGDYNPAADAIQIMTMKVSKGMQRVKMSKRPHRCFICGGDAQQQQ